VKCLRLLLEKGAKVILDNDGVSPLELCAKVQCHCRRVLSIMHCGVCLVCMNGPIHIRLSLNYMYYMYACMVCMHALRIFPGNFLCIVPAL
jgi:hypothetical protein